MEARFFYESSAGGGRLTASNIPYQLCELFQLFNSPAAHLSIYRDIRYFTTFKYYKASIPV
jgi:hypothetical protein